MWLINSNGVLFGKNAKVNTAGIVASTKDISNEDFNNGNYNFKGNSTASIVNEGEIKSLANTHATFIANSVTNKGKIEVHKGTINLVGASDVTLTLNENQNISLKVNKGVVDALVDNQNLIVANGGNVYLTTNAKDELLKGVVNNSGIIEATSLDDLQSEVILFSNGGTANISGEIKAKDSFVETSGDKVKVADNFKVSANKWLIDPNDFTVAASGGDMTGQTLSNNLNNTNVDIHSKAGTVNTNGKGDIFVNDEVTWSSDKILILSAQNDIFINKSITATNNNAKLGLIYGQASSDGGNSDYYVNAKVNLKAGDNFATQKGGNPANFKVYTVITSLGTQTSFNDGTLQGINGNLNGNYVLGSNIDATETNSWNSNGSGGYYGFNPIGDNTSEFNGTFDGLGFTISNLYINRPAQHHVGLFGYTNNATIKNIGVVDFEIYALGYSGGLAGSAYNNTQISNSYSTGGISADNDFGGLIGHLNESSSIEYSYSLANINKRELSSGFLRAGGLVGTVQNSSSVKNSYSIGNITGGNTNDDEVGGLIGYLHKSSVLNSYSSRNINASGNTNDEVGGLIGKNNDSNASNSFYDKTKYTGNGVGSSSQIGVTGKTTAELEDINTFQNAYWSITADTALAKGTPILKNGSWVIGTYVAPTPTPTPTNNNQKPKVDEKVQRVIASIEPSLNSNSSSNQSVPNSLNINIRTLSFNGVDEIRVINGGVRVPDDIVNSLDEL